MKRLTVFALLFGVILAGLLLAFGVYAVAAGFGAALLGLALAATAGSA